MNINMKEPVEVTCYGETKKYKTRKDAIVFFLDCFNYSEGAEQQRYAKIYAELTSTNNTKISDE